MTLDSFETSLLTDLREHVTVRATRRQTTRRVAWISAPIAAVGAAATALVLTLAPSSAAYAVDQEANGDVIVTIHNLSDAHGLTDALAAKGVHAQVTYEPGFTQTPGTQRASGTGVDDCTIRLVKLHPGLQFTLAAAPIASGAELTIVTSGSSASDVGSPVAASWSGGTC